MSTAFWSVRAYLAVAAVAGFAQTVDFDTASVRRSAPGSPAAVGANAINRGFIVDPTTFLVRNATLKLLIERAYGLEDYQILGGDSWIQSERFDISARSTTPATDKRMNQMLQTLLADRFRLKFHTESRNIAVNVLSVARGGPKFGASFHAVGGNEPANKAAAHAVDQVTFRGVDIGTFAKFLHLNLVRDLTTGRTTNPQDIPPVVDKTGIQGTYDITVNTANESDWSGLLERQLGLKLELHHIPIEIMVIDSAAKPDPNE